MQNNPLTCHPEESNFRGLNVFKTKYNHRGMNKNLLKHKKRALAVGTADRKCEA
jgi:hypothetical protein